jgi:hypothetical protein
MDPKARRNRCCPGRLLRLIDRHAGGVLIRVTFPITEWPKPRHRTKRGPYTRRDAGIELS